MQLINGIQTAPVKMHKVSIGKMIFLVLMIALAFNCGKGGKTPKAITESAASDILERINVSRGIGVVLGDHKCKLSTELVSLSELVLYLQFDDDEDVHKARAAADDAGLFGTRIYVEKADPVQIHLADNLADAVIVLSEPSAVSDTEVLRVLRPEGIALIGKRKLVKPFPQGIDDWSHPFHSADNNPQSSDQLARAPYLTQFFAEPHYAPVTQVAVASAGRIFKGFGNIAFKEREEPWLNKLVAFNGYNGTLLWERDLTPGVMLHRNILIATPDLLYLGDDKSCKLIDARTGEMLDEIIPPLDIAGGTFWKWIGMENGVLYALIGEQEQKDPVTRWKRQQHGWPWNAISKGYNQYEHAWGFGRNVLAIDPKSKKIKWYYHEEEPVDSRGMCMKNGRIFLFRFGSFLTCLHAESGRVLWRKTRDRNPDFFEAFGQYLTRQGAGCNWRTRNYLLCSDEALYFAGPQIDKLLAVSAIDGSILWENPYNNFQLILRDDGLYGISAAWGYHESKKFDPLTGEILAELPTSRCACTRPNAAIDAILFRAADGTVRLDVASGSPQWISPMRPPCHDGVTIANGMLYWWPYVCDCLLSIYGVTGLGPAGEFQFNAQAIEAERLEKGNDTSATIAGLFETPADWLSFRKDNRCSATTGAVIPVKGAPLWRFPQAGVYVPGTNVLGHAYSTLPTAPVTADGLAFYGNTDGIVRAIDVITGKVLWKAYTSGAIRIAPTIWQGRLYVGSGDGWVYCLKARTGEMIWRFRAAPAERKIPVYGSLQSTWPLAEGVLVEDGIAYVAAGIVNYDGTHLYAIDAKTGEIEWQNNTSGHLYPEARTGVSVQGHLLINDGKLYLASGTSVSPAIFDIADGTCLNDPEQLKKCEASCPRGWELTLIGDNVFASGKPFYSHPKHDVYHADVTNQMVHASTGTHDIVWKNRKQVICYPKIEKRLLNSCVSNGWLKGADAPFWQQLQPLWEYNCDGSAAIAVCNNAVVVAEKSQLAVLDISNGKTLWSSPLEYAPVPWGLAISRDGSILLALEDGSIQCFGGAQTVPVPYVNSGNLFFKESARVALACDTKDAQIRYTLDGTEPTQHSTLYTSPFTLRDSATLMMRAFQPDGIPGFVVTEKFTKVDYSKAKAPAKAEIGMRYDYFKGLFSFVAELDSLTPVRSGAMTRFRTMSETGVDEFGTIFRGMILIPEDGSYTFYVESNDGSKFYIDGKELIDNDGGHTAIECSGEIFLKAGDHPFVLKYFQMGGAEVLNVAWEGPGFRKKELTAEVIFHEAAK
ncbi:PQQ-binding-like beta-propeller repeat protein [candidate division KSB1 bacterium]|nr:PQQ-binding-like beta-propeller repeat protein [candidate division KSB1 bacterium]